MKKILIRSGRLFDGHKFFDADLLIEDKTIAKIEKNITDAADIVFDAAGKIVSAGLVDAHTHLRGISPDSIGMHPEMCTFPFGVTAAVDASARQGGREIADRLMVKTAVLVCAWIKDGRADFSEAEKMLEAYGSRVVGIKVYYDTNVAETEGVAPLQEISEYARKKGLKLMVHSTRSPVSMAEIVDTLGEGEIISHAFHGGKNNASEDGFECLKKAKQRGIVIDIGFAGNVHADYAVLKSAIECGALPDSISTDITKNSVYTRGGRYGLTMSMSMLRSLGMNEEDIFKAVTSTPARALGKADEWGELKVGRSADVAVLEYSDEGFDITDKAGNRLASESGYRCVLTVCDGQIVYRR